MHLRLRLAFLGPHSEPAFPCTSGTSPRRQDSRGGDPTYGAALPVFSPPARWHHKHTLRFPFTLYPDCFTQSARPFKYISQRIPTLRKTRKTTDKLALRCTLPRMRRSPPDGPPYWGSSPASPSPSCRIELAVTSISTVYAPGRGLALARPILDHHRPFHVLLGVPERFVPGTELQKTHPCTRMRTARAFSRYPLLSASAHASRPSRPYQPSTPRTPPRRSTRPSRAPSRRRACPS